MRIGHVITSIADLAAGTAYSVPAMCNHLVAMQHHVELHVLDYGGATRRDDARYALHTYSPLAGLHRLAVSPSMHRGLRAAAKRLDILHWHGLWMMPNIYPFWATRGTPCRLVVSPHGMLQPTALKRSKWLKGLAWQTAQGPAVRAAACAHATSPEEAQAIRNTGISIPIAIIPNGIDLPPLASPRGLDESSRSTLLFLGRVHPIKGIDRLIRAWRIVQDRFPLWDLTIVGPDCNDHSRELRSLVSELGASRVTFPGPVFGGARARTLGSATLHVLPSHSENFGMSVAESLAAGVPVVCSKGAPWQGLEAEGCGYWVDNHVTALADCLAMALARSKEDLAQMGDRGRRWMERDFSWPQKAEQMSIVYRWIAGQSGRPSTVAD